MTTTPSITKSNDISGAVRWLGRADDARDWLRFRYAPSFWKDIFFPIARRAVRTSRNVAVLGHYLRAPITEITFIINLLIWLEVITTILLALFVVWLHTNQQESNRGNRAQ